MQPKFAKEGGWETVSWCRGDKVYLLAGMGGRERLTEFL